jgi:RNA polymerase sigma-70 factor (ECF subfamily)
MQMGELPADSDETRHLLELARTGDRQAFERLFAQFREQLRRQVALRLDTRVQARLDASDVVQEAYLEAYRRLDQYLDTSPLPFHLWLRQIAYDRTLKAGREHHTSQRRSISREVPLPEQSSLLLAGQLLAGSTPSQHLNRAELAQRLRRVMAELPEIDREILVMRHFEGLSNQEVACLLGMEPGTVSKRHGRAMLRLHQLLFQSGVTESEL